MKKALLVANLAGFASFLIHDIELLQSMGYAVSYAANANKLEWADTKRKLDAMGVPFFQVDFDSRNPLAKENVRAYKQIRKIVSDESFDLVHCHTPIAGLITRLAVRKQRKHGTKVLYTTHGFAFTANSSRKSWLLYHTMEKFGSLFCDGMITINREDYAHARQMWCKKVYYINGVGVDVDAYRNVEVDRAAYRKSIGVGENQLMVLSVGELSERKNHRIIIDALSTIRELDMVYVICGNGINGGTRSMLEELAAQKNVKLIMLGFRFDIPQITAISDIGAIPSIREGLGLAGIQSLAAGVPLVGTDVQGIRDYIVDGETGYLAKADDADGFAHGLRLLADASAREAMKEKCVEMSRRFSTQVSRKQMEAIYREMLTD